MPEFRDVNGRSWQVNLDACLIKEIRQTLSFDVIGDRAFEQLATDDVLLVDVLWMLCRSQAAGIKDVEFAACLASGDVIQKACDALIGARNFFFRPERRSMVRDLETTQAEILTKGMELASAKIKDPLLMATFLKKMETDMQAALDKVLTGATGASNLPESSASLPAD